MKYVINEKQFQILKEHLDKDYGMSLYDYLRNGKYDASTSQKYDAQLDGNVVFSNPKVTQVKWLIHFTTNDNVDDIMTNGFSRGLGKGDFDKMAYTSQIKQKDKDNGQYSYGYDAEDIINDEFSDKYGEMYQDTKRPFENSFDLKVWVNAIHDAVMFKANGVKAYHMTDEDYQVIFYNNTARDFVKLHCTFENGKYLWNVMTNGGKVLYSNKSITKVVEWVVNNHGQYHKTIEKDAIDNIDGFTKKEILNYMSSHKPNKEYMDNYNHNVKEVKKAFLTGKVNRTTSAVINSMWHYFEWKNRR